jgi:hypothetical protein
MQAAIPLCRRQSFHTLKWSHSRVGGRERFDERHFVFDCNVMWFSLDIAAHDSETRKINLFIFANASFHDLAFFQFAAGCFGFTNPSWIFH